MKRVYVALVLAFFLFMGLLLWIGNCRGKIDTMTTELWQLYESGEREDKETCLVLYENLEHQWYNQRIMWLALFGKDGVFAYEEFLDEVEEGIKEEEWATVRLNVVHSIGKLEEMMYYQRLTLDNLL